jgi:hypothetical protein
MEFVKQKITGSIFLNNLSAIIEINIDKKGGYLYFYLSQNQP